MRIETTNEQNELTQARKKIRELEAALSQMTMRSLLSDSYLQIACEELDCDVEVFKKKDVTEVSVSQKQQAKEKATKWA